MQLAGFSFPFASMGIATSIIAILTLPVMHVFFTLLLSQFLICTFRLILDNLRKGAVTSMILVEIPWLGILWVLFLATAGNASQSAAATNEICALRNFGPVSIHLGLNDPTVCREYKAIQAVGHLTWLALFVYLLVLTTLSIKLANRGYNRVWYQSVKDTDFNAPPVNAAPVSLPTQQYISSQQAEAYYPPQAPGWAGTPQQPSITPVHKT
ncbi:hypothetical protein C0995_015916 [Termitomyces sp. Mi166|nr:hypothetical protein C0995_015916 [Termitomyces sp. Mi166\